MALEIECIFCEGLTHDKFKVGKKSICEACLLELKGVLLNVIQDDRSLMGKFARKLLTRGD